MATQLDVFKAVLLDAATDYTDPQLEVFLGLAVGRTGLDCFTTAGLEGDYSVYRQFIAYLAGHLLSLAERSIDGSTGPVIARRAGEVSTQYGYSGAQLDRAGLMSTPFGQQVLALQQQLSCTHMFTTYGFDGAGNPALGTEDSFDA